MNKKQLTLAVLVGVMSIGGGFGQGLAADDNFAATAINGDMNNLGPGPFVAQGGTIRNYGITDANLSSAGELGSFSLFDSATITAKGGEQAAGIYLDKPSKIGTPKFTGASKLTISAMDGTKSNRGLYIAGQGETANLTALEIDVRGNNSVGLDADKGAVINGASKAVINATDGGDLAIGVKATVSQIKLGDYSEIKASSTKVGQAANQAIFAEQGSVITLGDHVHITAEEATLSNAGISTEDSTVTVGEGSYITGRTTQKDDSGKLGTQFTYGINAINSNVTIGANSAITAESPNQPQTWAISHVTNKDAGDKTLKILGGTTIEGKIEVKARNNTDATTLEIKEGDGVRKIVGDVLSSGEHALADIALNNDVSFIKGDVKAEKKGNVKLALTKGSTLTGMVSVKDEGSKVTLTASGSNVNGNLQSDNKGTLNLSLQESALNGDITANTGNVVATADKSTLNGNITANGQSLVEVHLENGATLRGTTTLGSDTDVLNIEADGSTWEVMGNSTVSDFGGKDSTIDMMKQSVGTATGQDLTINRLTGTNHTFRIDVDTTDTAHKNHKTDFIKIEEANPNTKATIETSPEVAKKLSEHKYGTDAKPNPILFADTDENVSFEAGTATSALANYQFKITSDIPALPNPADRKLWYIYDANRNVTLQNKALQAYLGYVYGGAMPRVELDSIHDRIGALQQDMAQSGAWVRTTHGTLKSNTDMYNFKDKYHFYQLGYDTVMDKGEVKDLTGVAISTRQNNLSMEGASGTSKNYGVEAYKSLFFNDGRYFDVVLGLNKIKSDVTADKDTAKHHTWAQSFSVEAGKKIERDGMFLIPSAQLSYTHINGKTFSTMGDDPIHVNLDGVNSFIGRLAVKAGMNTSYGMHFVKLGVAREFKGGYHAMFTTSNDSEMIDASNRDTWLEIGVGGNVNFKDFSVYYDLDKTYKSKYNTSWQVNVGVKKAF